MVSLVSHASLLYLRQFSTPPFIYGREKLLQDVSRDGDILCERVLSPASVTNALAADKLPQPPCSFSCFLSVLCASVVSSYCRSFTTYTRRTRRLHRTYSDSSWYMPLWSSINSSLTVSDNHRETCHQGRGLDKTNGLEGRVVTASLSPIGSG